ncbi:STM4504/CBY_0614 family protein [Rhodoferax sp.]|uniref:STM4504/CBY_0614 family protein n=1 Tax=Rhodoferax sp. TaxID=50421 RepID=UPI00374D2659
MAIFDLFSKRQKKLRGDVPDVYVYDDLPSALRTQIVHIWLDTLGNRANYYDEGKAHEYYSFIVNTLCREYGLFKLPGTKDYGDREYINELTNFFLHEQDIERSIDAVELSFRAIDRVTRDYYYLHRQNADDLADAAIKELNGRFKEHGVGYQFADGEMIRVDSELVHSEVVKPALRLLNQKNYAGAQQEFLKAHEHYRHGNEKEALNECLKAFESLMKSICDKRGWGYSGNATAKNLIQACLDNGLIPAFWQQNFTSLRSLLESSIPTGRNKLGGHGQGVAATTVPDYLVAYMLHMTASALVFLGEAEASLP